MLKKATIRKEQEPDFEEKRFTVTIGEDDRDFDKENDFFRERAGYRITREIRDAGYDKMTYQELNQRVMSSICYLCFCWFMKCKYGCGQFTYLKVIVIHLKLFLKHFVHSYAY